MERWHSVYDGDSERKKESIYFPNVVKLPPEYPPWPVNKCEGKNKINIHSLINKKKVKLL